MRISTAAQWSGYDDRIRETQARSIAAQEKMVDGKRLHRPSDDPAGLSGLLDVRGYRSSVEAYRTNIARGTNLLKSAEGALSEVSAALERGYTLAVGGANATTGQEGRKAMAVEVDGLAKRITELANARDADGTYLFAGQKNDRPAYAVDATGALAFTGDARAITVESDLGETTPANVDASKALQDAYAGLVKLKESLEGGDVVAIGDARMGEMQAAKTAVEGLRGQVGVQQSTLASRDDVHDRRLVELTGRASDIEEVDFAAAITEYQQAQTAYSAALQVTSSASRTSLMDYLR